MAPPETPRRADAPAVVGRELERARIDGFREDIADGPRMLILHGAQGVGRSTLWWYGVERSRAHGIQVLLTRPVAEEIPLALVGVDDLLRHADAAAPDGADDVLAHGRALLETLRRLAVDAPVLLAIDDVQWLDPASVRALRFALRRLDRERVGVLATARDADDPLPLAHDLGWPLDALAIGPLPAPALRRVLAGTLPALSKPLLRRIAEASGGSPLHALEFARALAADSRADEAPRLPLPESLHTAIGTRLERASNELTAVLETLAALGHATAADLKEALPGTDVDAALASGRRSSLLADEVGLDVRFAHPAIGVAVDERMPAARRRALHAALAAGAADDDARVRHLAIAARGPDPAVADAIDAAADRALARGASALAAELATRAVQLTPARADDHLRRAQREVQLLARAGEAARALERADRLVAGLPAGPRRAEALVLRSKLTDSPAAAVRLLSTALDEAAADARVLVAVRQELAFTRFLAFGDVDGALGDARETAEIADRIGDEQTTVLARADLAHLEGVAGRPQLEPIRRAVALDDGETTARRRARTLLAKQLRWAGELELARDACVGVAGDELARASLLNERALIEVAAGDLDAGDALVRAGADAARDAGYAYLEALLDYPRGLIAAARGSGDEARAAAAAIAARAVEPAMRHERIAAARILGTLALAQGDAATAAAELQLAAQLCADCGIRHPGVYPVLADAVEAVALSRGPEAAAPIFRRLERESAAIGGVWAGATAARARGVLRLAEGRADAAVASLGAALAGFDGCGFRPDAARSLLARGRALLRLGRRSQALADLAEASQRLSEIDAVPWRERADEELERARRRTAAGGLTSTETRITRLVAGGMRNVEVAAALSISVATVEAHLTRAYRKLDVRSRSELARLVADGLVDDAP